jgi:hypothetical protein
MRQESTRICKAFIARRYAKAARTTSLGHDLLLHGNRIAWWNPDGSVSMTLAGWGTPTTRDRLNTLCWLLFQEKPFHQVKHVQHYNGKPISADDTFTFHPIADEFKLAA